MIKFFSSWVKTLGLAIVVVSVLEMLLPDNKTKKYVRMVMGIYVLFTIISPFISNKEMFNINNIDFENYVSASSNVDLNNNSMDKRIQNLYIEELQKDITKKLNEKGYVVQSCIVDAQITDKEEETKITKIRLQVEKSQIPKEESQEDLENKIVVGIQKIKPIDVSSSDVTKDNTSKDNSKENGLSQADIQNIKKFLIQEYGVDEKCLEIN